MTRVFFAAFALLFLLGIAAGLLLSEDSAYGMILSAIYQAAQIPVITSFALTYKMMSGALVGCGIFGSKFLILGELGAHIVLFFGQSTSAPGVGINILALFFLCYLLRAISKKILDQGEVDADEFPG
ncbi:MAG: hypothetical protein ACYSWQ_12565 [Planctomycetota bacterium]